MSPLTPEECRALLARHDYAIIPPPSRASHFWREELPLEQLLPFQMRRHRSAASMPSLLPLKPETAPHLERLAGNLIAAHDVEKPPASREQPIFCCLLRAFPRVRPAGIAHHLADRLILSSRAGRERGLLRYYEPATFIHLRRILPRLRLASLYGTFVAEWTFPFQGQWLSLPRPEVDPDKGDVLPLAWQVDIPIRDKIAIIANVRDALAYYENDLDRDWLGLEEYDAKAEIAERAVLTAQGKYHLERNKDLALFALHALRHGEDFHCHPILQNILRVPGINYHSATVTGITDEQWQHIAAESMAQSIEPHHHWNTTQGEQHGPADRM
jgi:hypothetical protein